MTNYEYPSVSLEKIEFEAFIAECLRCGHKWKPRQIDLRIKSMPKQCPRCHSPYWFKERMKTGEAGSRNKYGFDQWEIGKWYLLERFVTDNGKIDVSRNAARWQSLAQFARRRGYLAHFDGNSGKMWARLVHDSKQGA